MKNSTDMMPLASLDNLFSTETVPVGVAPDGRESVIEVQLTELHPFKNHPFKVVDDASANYVPLRLKALRILKSYRTFAQVEATGFAPATFGLKPNYSLRISANAVPLRAHQKSV